MRCTIFVIFVVFGLTLSAAENNRRRIHRRNHQNGCVHNEAKQTLVCRCHSERGQESWQIPNLDGYSLRRINVQCCAETQPLELQRFLDRVGNYRGTVHVKGGCCYNGRIPEQITVMGAINCGDLPDWPSDDSPEYIEGEKLVRSIEPMMADAPSTYREGDENDDEEVPVIINENSIDRNDNSGGNDNSGLNRNNQRRNRNRTRPPPATCDLNGLWYNEHGSELYLQQRHGQLTGEYRTAVEVECGSAGRNYSHVHGSIVGRLFSFHVHWAAKKSVTTWVGQCHESCEHGFLPIGGEPMLHATWVLTSEINDCNDAWMQNRIGQNVFTRRQLKKGPRKLEGTHHPVRNE